MLEDHPDIIRGYTPNLITINKKKMEKAMEKLDSFKGVNIQIIKDRLSLNKGPKMNSKKFLCTGFVFSLEKSFKASAIG